MNRRDVIKGLLALPLVGCLPAVTLSEPEPGAILKRVIPSSGESIPAIGLGTYKAFSSLGDSAQQQRLTQVLQLFSQRGGRVIDTSPMYSQAESVLGSLLPQVTTPKDGWFLATKVWIDGQEAGQKQMTSSAQKIGSKLDLIQIHNLRDWQLHLPTLKDMKAAGKLRYIGATTWGGLDHEELAKVMRKGSLDFIQVSYNLFRRTAEERLFPLAKDLGIAIIVNRPFAQGEMFGRVKGRKVPAWLKTELGCETWAQVFLKFCLSDQRVTVVIPATSKPKHLVDNMGAGSASLLNQEQRERLLALFDLS